MSFSVAVEAIGSNLSGSSELGMGAVRGGTFCVRVTTCAEDFLWRRVVRDGLYILMTIDAGKLHGAVDRVLKFFAVDEEGDRLAVDVFGKRRVAMTSEAVFVFQFVLGTNGEGRAQQKEKERTEQDSAGSFHGYEETLIAIGSR